MVEHLFTGAWQLFGYDKHDYFGMVAGTVRLNGDTRIQLFFNRVRVNILEEENEYVIELSEPWAKVFCEDLSATLIRSNHLYKLYSQGRLTPHAVYSGDLDTLSPSSTRVSSVRSASEPICITYAMETDVQTDILSFYNEDSMQVGSVTAFGSEIGAGTVHIKLCKSALTILLDDGRSLDIRMLAFSCQQLCQRVRDAIVELNHLHVLKRFGVFLY